VVKRICCDLGPCSIHRFVCPGGIEGWSPGSFLGLAFDFVGVDAFFDSGAATALTGPVPSGWGVGRDGESQPIRSEATIIEATLARKRRIVISSRWGRKVAATG
jgi:hypothetical protein